MARSARALVVELVADTKDFVKGTQKADQALGDFVRGADQDLERLETQAGQSFDAIAREAKTSFKKAERAADTSAHEMGVSFGEAGKESGGEFASNLSETLSSGDFTALGTDTAAGLVAGFANMPGLGAALAPLAAGAALIFGSIVKEAERRAAQVSAAFERAAASSLEALDLTERGAAFKTFISELGGGDVAKGMKAFNTQAKAAGVNVTDIKEAFIAGGAPLDAMVAKLNAARDQGTKIIGNARTGRIESDKHANAANNLAVKLEQANADLATGVGLAGQLNSRMTSADAARAVTERTTAYGNQANDLNSQAEAIRRINTGLTDPAIGRAIDERTRKLHAQEVQASATAAATRGPAGTVVGGRRASL